jgi:hypothetical protein
MDIPLRGRRYPNLATLTATTGPRWTGSIHQLIRELPSTRLTTSYLDRPDLILTADAMSLLTKTCPPLLPEIDEDVIRDFSQADTITKVLAILQALYQFVSVVARLALELPISQLEVNKFGHVLCAFAILSIWRKKLKDVKVRTEIRDPWETQLCAYLWMCSELSCASRFSGLEIMALFPVLGKG